jgi:hypothetical protein
MTHRQNNATANPLDTLNEIKHQKVAIVFIVKRSTYVCVHARWLRCNFPPNHNNTARQQPVPS